MRQTNIKLAISAARRANVERLADIGHRHEVRALLLMQLVARCADKPHYVK